MPALSLALDGLRASLHPSGGRRAVLIVAGPGFEDLCAHRFLLGLAQECAHLGLPALRIDLRGTGDSVPAPLDGALVSRWMEDIAAAARWLRHELGCKEIAVAGLRLGALLAAGALRDPILAEARVALLAPPSSGRGYLRELKLLARVIAAPPAAPGAEGLEVAGFHMPPGLLDGIGRLDWSPLGTAPPRPVLVCGAPDASLAASLATGGHGSLTVPFDGYDRLMCDPTASIVPGGTLRRVAEWLADGGPAGLCHPAATPPTRISGPCWREEGLAFDRPGHGEGILCMPQAASGGPLVVFTNAGGIRRTGWGQMWVEMARRLAAEGIASFRFDFSNLDVDPDTGADAPAFHYGDDIWSELSAVADLAQERGFGPLVAVGACSGAYHALRAAERDPRIAAAVLINQLCYTWSPGHALPLAAWMKQKAGDFDRKRRAQDDGETTELARLRARLMVEAIRLAKSSAKAALRHMRALAILLPGSEGGATASAASRLQDVCMRGCLIEVMQSAGDPSVAEYDREVGLAPGALPNLTRTIIPEADHLLTPHAAREIVFSRVRAAARALEASRVTLGLSA